MCFKLPVMLLSVAVSQQLSCLAVYNCQCFKIVMNVHYLHCGINEGIAGNLESHRGVAAETLIDEFQPLLVYVNSSL
jgi:hypothetical protein